MFCANKMFVVGVSSDIPKRLLCAQNEAAVSL